MTPQEKALKDRIEQIKRANNVHIFPTLCQITRLDGSVGTIVPTYTQQLLLEHIAAFSWTYTLKFRQAASSTIHVADQLRHVAFTPGAMGMLIGDKEDTYKELMRRMAIMYNGLNESIRPPLARAPSSESIVFSERHNGLIQGVTGGGENPAIGFSPDYAIISEYGLYQFFDKFNGAFFPAINRRPNAKCRIETTPGTYNSAAHEMYKAALQGKGRFKALFLSWWRDATCISHDPPMPSDYEPEQSETEYAASVNAFDVASIGQPWYPYKEHQPISREHLWFRRISMETEFNGDYRLFDNKYPPNPFAGWLVGSSPTIPPEPLERLRAKAKPVDEDTEVFLEEPEPGCPYLITVDGAGYGKTGDPAAIVLWNMWDWRAVGMWSGREDPGQVARRVVKWQRKYNADVIAETNKDGVAAALQVLDCPKLYWSSSEQPGWYSSQVSKSLALSNLVDMLRANEIDIPFAPMIEQLSSWDGKTRAQSTGKTRHHWDLAICCLIFTFGVTALGYPRRPQKKVVQEWAGWTASSFDQLFKKPERGNVLGMPQ